MVWSTLSALLCEIIAVRTPSGQNGNPDRSFHATPGLPSSKGWQFETVEFIPLLIGRTPWRFPAGPRPSPDPFGLSTLRLSPPSEQGRSAADESLAMEWSSIGSKLPITRCYESSMHRRQIGGVKSWGRDEVERHKIDNRYYTYTGIPAGYSNPKFSFFRTKPKTLPLREVFRPEEATEIPSILRLQTFSLP